MNTPVRKAIASPSAVRAAWKDIIPKSIIIRGPLGVGKSNDIILEEARQAHAGGKPVVIDGNFYHKEQIEQLFHALGDETVVITLRASVETCLVRDAAREKPYGEDATRVVHMFVSRFDYGTIIDTENQTVDETIQAVMNIVRQIL